MLSNSSSNESFIGKLSILKKGDPTSYGPWRKAVTNILIGKQLDAYISKDPSNVAKIIQKWVDCEEGKDGPCLRGRADLYHKIKGEHGRPDKYLCGECYLPLQPYVLNENELKAFKEERAMKALTFGIIFASIDNFAKEAVNHIPEDSPLKLWEELNGWYQQNTKSYKLTILNRILTDVPKDHTTDNVISYVSRLRTFRNQISELGGIELGDVLLALLFKSLSKEYEVSIQVFKEREDKNTFDDAVDHVIAKANEIRNGKFVRDDKPKGASVNTVTQIQNGKPNKNKYKNNKNNNWKNKNNNKNNNNSSKNASIYDEEEGFIGIVEANALEASSNDECTIDSGTNVHTVTDLDFLQDIQELDTNSIQATVANGSKMEFTQKGTYDIFKNFRLSDVLYSKNASKNLISVSAMLRKNPRAACLFYYDRMLVVQNGKDLLDTPEMRAKMKVPLQAQQVNGLYTVRKQTSEKTKMPRKVTFSNKLEIHNVETELWHARLGHLSYHSIKKMAQKDELKNPALKEIKPEEELKTPCTSCIRGKMNRAPFGLVSSRKPAEQPLERIFYDLAGPIKVDKTIGITEFLFDLFGKREYFSLIADACTTRKFVQAHRSKDEVTPFLISWIKQQTNITGSTHQIF